MSRDKDRTKTCTDRLIELCPRALAVLKRHLVLRARLQLAGKIKHEELFFKENGEPIRNLQYPYVRWRRTLAITLKGRYREPYSARHSSVSWNLMVGKNPLWVAKQHGHSVQTMLDTYAAWTEGAGEAGVAAIKQAMEGNSKLALHSQSIIEATGTDPLRSPESGNRLAIGHARPNLSCENKRENYGGERGIRTLEGLLTLTPLAGVRLRPLGHLSARLKIAA
jgi:hypothetical protein